MERVAKSPTGISRNQLLTSQIAERSRSKSLKLIKLGFGICRRTTVATFWQPERQWVPRRAQLFARPNCAPPTLSLVVSLGDQIQKAKYHSGWRGKNVESRKSIWYVRGCECLTDFTCAHTVTGLRGDSSIAPVQCALPLIPGPVCRSSLKFSEFNLETFEFPSDCVSHKLIRSLSKETNSTQKMK